METLPASLNCRLLLVNFSDKSTLDGLCAGAKAFFDMEVSGSIDEVTIYAPYPKGRNKGADLNKADCAMQIRCRTFYEVPAPHIEYEPSVFNHGQSILIRVNGHLTAPNLSALDQVVTVETLRHNAEVDTLRALKVAANHFKKQTALMNVSSQMKTRVNWYSECITKTLMHDPSGGGFSSGSSYDQIQASAGLELTNPAPPFATLLRGDATAIVELTPARCSETSSISYILLLMMKNMQARLQHHVLKKTIQRGRLGDVLVHAVPNDMKDASQIVFPVMPFNEHQSYEPKGCLVWVCALSTWEKAEWMLSQPHTDIDLRELGAFCYVHSAGAQGRMYKIAPRLEGLPVLVQEHNGYSYRLNIQQQPFPAEEKFPVVVWHLEKVHTQFNQYTAISNMKKDVQPGASGEAPKPDPWWAGNVRALLGLSAPAETSPQAAEATASFFERLFGAADSSHRMFLIQEAECRLGDGIRLSVEQKRVLLSIRENISVVEMAAGAGKTFLVSVIAMLFEKAAANKAILITQQNVNMVSEIVERLKVVMPASLVVRLGYNHSTNEDGWAAAWEQVVNTALEREVIALTRVEKYIDQVRPTIKILLKVLIVCKATRVVFFNIIATIKNSIPCHNRKTIGAPLETASVLTRFAQACWHRFRPKSTKVACIACSSS